MTEGQKSTICCKDGEEWHRMALNLARANGRKTREIAGLREALTTISELGFKLDCCTIAQEALDA